MAGIRTLAQLRAADTPSLAAWIRSLAGDAAAMTLQEDLWDGEGFARLLFASAAGHANASLKAGCEELLERKLRWRPGVAYKVAAHLETLAGVQAGSLAGDNTTHLQSPPVPRAGMLPTPAMTSTRGRSAIVAPAAAGSESSTTSSDDSSSSSSSSSTSSSSNPGAVRAPKTAAVKPHPVAMPLGSLPKKAAAANKPGVSAKKPAPSSASSAPQLSSPLQLPSTPAARSEPVPAFKSVRVQPLPSSAPAVGGGLLTLPKSGYVRFDEEGNPLYTENPHAPPAAVQMSKRDRQSRKRGNPDVVPAPPRTLVYYGDQETPPPAKQSKQLAPPLPPAPKAFSGLSPSLPPVATSGSLPLAPPAAPPLNYDLLPPVELSRVPLQVGDHIAFRCALPPDDHTPLPQLSSWIDAHVIATPAPNRLLLREAADGAETVSERYVDDLLYCRALKVAGAAAVSTTASAPAKAATGAPGADFKDIRQPGARRERGKGKRVLGVGSVLRAIQRSNVEADAPAAGTVAMQP